MKITRIESIPISLPLRKTFRTSYGIRDSADFVIVVMETDEGLTGIGEASTIPIYDQGNQRGTEFVLQKYLIPYLIGKDPRDIASIHNLMDRVLVGERFAKAAIDFCLYDILGKVASLPARQVLGSLTDTVPVVWALDISDTFSTEKEIIAKRSEGFSSFKLKVGIDIEEDEERVAVARKVLGKDGKLRLDANGAWSPKEAIRNIERLEKYGPELIEQPVPPWDIEGLRAVTNSTEIPISADESVLTLHDALRVVQEKAADLINIKVSRSKGIFHSMKIAHIAEAAGVKVLVGSMLETGIGTVASANLATLFVSELATELIGPLYFKEDIIKPTLTFTEGVLTLPQGSGFGIQIDYEKLCNYRIGPIPI